MGIVNGTFKNASIACALLILCACEDRVGLAPVEESRWRAANSHATRHVVTRGETLYAIAFRYDQDYQSLAVANRLYSPYTLRVGQVLYLQPGSVNLNVAPRQQNRVVRYAAIDTRQQPSMGATGWSWPAEGRIVASFLPAQGKKGINIAGHKGEKIRAARGGVVAYAGSGIAGYGNLIIIKHDDQYLTAYGNNSINFVKEGQRIKAHQVIAQMGVVDRRYWGVHFEVRKMGKPVNPLNYLQKG